MFDRHVFVPIPVVAVMLTVSAASAQRFDNWVGPSSAAGVAWSNAATSPVDGAPTMIRKTPSGSDTVRWDGAAFVSMGLTTNPGTAQNQILLPFDNGTTKGFVHLDPTGVTSRWTSGATSWTSLGVLVPSPPARTNPAVATAVGPGGHGFLFGGTGAAGVLNDLWSFDGSVWANRTPTSGSLPSARAGASLAINGQGGLLMLGGSAGSGILDELWEWNGTIWQFAGKGPGRAFHASLLDVSRGVLLIAGGADFVPPNDAWTLPLPRTGLVGLANWTQITTALPFTPGTGQFTTAALDAVRNEIVAADRFGFDVVHDKVASSLAFAISPSTSCVTPNLQLVSAVQPRVLASGTASVPFGGLTGVAGAPMVLLAETVTPGIGFAPAGTPIPGSSCLVFLSSAAVTVGSTTTLPGGQYSFTMSIPPNPAVVGMCIDKQAFGLFGSLLGASEAIRVVIGSS